MYRTGHVVELTKHQMRLALDPSPACSSCKSSSAGGTGCGGLFSAWWQQTRRRDLPALDPYRSANSAKTPVSASTRDHLDLDRMAGVSVGDRVRVDIKPEIALKLAFVAYCVPVLLMLLGALLSHLLFPPGGETGMLSMILAPAMGLMGFIGGLFAYRPLVNYLLDGRDNGRDARGNSLLRTSLLVGPG